MHDVCVTNQSYMFFFSLIEKSIICLSKREGIFLEEMQTESPGRYMDNSQPTAVTAVQDSSFICQQHLKVCNHNHCLSLSHTQTKL